MITCARCGRLNDGKLRFCLGCGAPLPVGKRRPSAALSVPPPPPDETDEGTEAVEIPPPPPRPPTALDDATSEGMAAVGPAALAAELADAGLPWASGEKAGAANEAGSADAAPPASLDASARGTDEPAALNAPPPSAPPPSKPPTPSTGMLRAAPPRPPSAPDGATPSPRTPPPRGRGRSPVPPPAPLRRDLVESGAVTPPTSAPPSNSDKLQVATPAPGIERANATPVEDLEALEPGLAPDTTERGSKRRSSSTAWQSRPQFTAAGRSSRPSASREAIGSAATVDNPEDAQPTVAVDAPLSADLVETLSSDDIEEAPAPAHHGDRHGFDPQHSDQSETPSAIAEYQTPPRVETYDTGKHRAPPASCWKCGASVLADDRFCGTCGAANPAEPPPADSADSGEIVVRLAVIDDMGNEADVFELTGGKHHIGRDEACAIAFSDDPLLAADHACLVTAPSRAMLQPLDEFNGTYLRIASPIELEHGDVIRIGQEVLRFERFDRLTAVRSLLDGGPIHVGAPVPSGIWGRLCQLGLSRQVCNAYLLSSQDVFLGRERGDILFPRDGFVSGSHAVISERNGRVYLKDLGSSNGTFVRVKSDVSLQEGDLLLLGRNLLRVKMGTA